MNQRILPLSDDLSCKEFVELVTDYLEDALPPQENVRFKAHLAECEGCEIYLTQMRQTIRLVGTLSEEALSEPAKETLLQAFRDWKREQ